jgi:hypothetical protein
MSLPDWYTPPDIIDQEPEQPLGFSYYTPTPDYPDQRTFADDVQDAANATHAAGTMLDAAADLFRFFS